MKRTLAVLFALSISAPGWAAGFSTGTFQCATTDNTITAVWKVSAFNANVPYVEVSITENADTTTFQGIGTVETDQGTTVIGISSMQDGGSCNLQFNSDGTIQMGSLLCTQTGN